MSDKIVFKVNGKECQVGCEVSSDTMLLDYIREYLELRGTKYMCLEAGCGACIVTARKPQQQPYAVNSCMTPVTACHGLEITTIEGVGNKKEGYNIVQTTLNKNNGSQCGYCSPGFVMAMHSLLQDKSGKTMYDIEQSLSSNVCRCTGYRSIMEAFKKFGKDAPEPNVIFDIEDLNICKISNEHCQQICTGDEDDWCIVNKFDVAVDKKIRIKLIDGKFWYRIVNIDDIFIILKEKGDDSYMLVGGNTAKGVFPIDEYPQILIDINGVKDLKGFTFDQNLIIGGGVTLTELLDILRETSKVEYFGYLQQLIEHLEKVAHVAVRNVGTIGGNLMIKHKHNKFPSDVYLLLETVGAQLTIVINSVDKATVTMQQFLKMNMKGKVILNVMLPPLSTEYNVVTFKVMPRRLNAYAKVNAGFLFQLSRNSVVNEARIVFGGLSPGFTRAFRTEEYLIGKDLFTNETLQSALRKLDDELVVTEEPPEPSAEYRRNTALALFYKALLTLCPDNKLHNRYCSGAIKLHDTRPVSQALQVYDTDPSVYPLTEPVTKIEGLYQCAGEAFYADDLPCLPREVFAAFTLTTEGSGEIMSIDAKNALDQPGVVAFYSAKDIAGVNSFVAKDQLVLGNQEQFCSGTIKYFNQPFGVIVAETKAIAERAAKLVKVQYENVKILVTNVKQAIKDPNRLTIFKAVDATEKSNDVYKIIKGSNTIYGQYHFTMENIICVTHPTEQGLKVYTSTQFPDGVHTVMSRALKINQSRIDISIKRIGGSYGMKLTQNIQSAVACGLVVQKLNRPCRFIQSLTSTTRSIGKRKPCASEFELAVNSSGVIQYMNYNMYHDEGYVVNELGPSMTLGSHYNNCYDKSRWNFKLFSAITDTPKNTWCRAPGSLEATACAELLMEQISYELLQDPVDVRLNNLDRKKYQGIENMYLSLKKKASYDTRRVAVNNFNKDNRWKKRGLRSSFFRWSSHPIGNFTVILCVYQGDGTVVITHGGIEMGQGVNTKAAQICAYYLKIPLDKIEIKGFQTITCPNAYHASSSIASQNVCVGVEKCCIKLLNRLAPFINKMTNASWEEIIDAAHKVDTDLQVQSHISPEDSKRYPYDVFGVSLAEVEIDVLTGESEILRVDLIEDVGKSVNPNIDIGQIEGSFIMGVGYWTSEKLTYSNTGELLTNRTWNYHVPLCTDIPQDFRVYFRENSYSYDGIFGAKAVGEPPICLAISVAFAIREAISEARCESGIPRCKWFPIDGPFTVDVIGLSTATNAKDFKFY